MKYLRALTDAIKLRKAQHNIHLHAFIYKESMKRLTVVDYVTVAMSPFPVIATYSRLNSSP